MQSFQTFFSWESFELEASQSSGTLGTLWELLSSSSHAASERFPYLGQRSPWEKPQLNTHPLRVWAAQGARCFRDLSHASLPTAM